jgi:hypothetical protein
MHHRITDAQKSETNPTPTTLLHAITAAACKHHWATLTHTSSHEFTQNLISTKKFGLRHCQPYEFSMVYCLAVPQCGMFDTTTLDWHRHIICTDCQLLYKHASNAAIS